MNRYGYLTGALLACAMFAGTISPQRADAASASQIDSKSTAALEQLYRTEPGARELAAKAKAILIFPSIVKAGFMIGAQYGEGALRRGGTTTGYYSSMAGSYGLQAGAQTFGYALFLMNDTAMTYLNKSEGWELGVGPTVVVVDSGAAKSLTTTTVHKDIYAFIFNQKGLMAGLGVQGSKITRINR